MANSTTLLTLEHEAPVAAGSIVIKALPAPTRLAVNIFCGGQIKVPNQPTWLRYYAAARPARKAVLDGKARVALFPLEQQATNVGLSKPSQETDADCFKRWLTAVDTAVPETPTENTFTGGAKSTWGLHDDGRYVLELLRINSATPIVEPAVSDRFYFRREALAHNLENGAYSLLCQPNAWGMYCDGRIIHTPPAYTTNAGQTMLGPHVPALGKEAFGRVRTWPMAPSLLCEPE